MRGSARIGETANAYKILIGKRDGKRSLGRCRRKQENTIKTGCTDIECDDVD
jgi:hypothetical protein